MLEVTVKTLDSQNHSFSVPDDSTVKEFKEQISPVLKIAADKQRLIFCGRVLQDDKKLSDYDVNGKVIHLVQRPPPQANQTSSGSSTSSSTGTSRSAHRDAAGFLLGAFTIPQDVIDATQVQNIVQDVVSGMGEIGRNATVMSRTSEDGSSVDVHINLGQVPLQSEAQLRMNRVQTMLIRANRLLESLEDGSNANGAGSSSDSPMQTDNEGDGEVRNSSPSPDESQNSPSHRNEPSIASDVNILNGSSFFASLRNSTDTPSEPLVLTSEPPDTETSAPETGQAASVAERFRFEGLAHAAHAAVTAAVAAAAAAARAATSSMGTPSINTGESAAQQLYQIRETLRSAGAEPMETASSEEAPLNLSENTATESVVLDSHLEPMEVPTTTTAASTTVVPDTEPVTSSEAPQDTRSSEPNHTPLGLNGQTTTTTSATNSRSTRRETTQPSVQTLANLLDEVLRLNTRLQPHLQRCMELIRSDPPLSGRQCGDAQRLFSRISQLMHFLSHAYHSLSDLHINFSQAPPRSPRVRIISSTSSPPLFHGIPVQAQISISTSSNVAAPSSQSTTTTANTSNSDVTNSTTEARPAPRLMCHFPPGAPRNGTGNSATNPSVQSVLRNQNPVVFMEVSPSSITIDSISSLDANMPNPAATSTRPPPSDTAENTDASQSTQSEQSTDNQSSPSRTATQGFTIPTLSSQGHPMANIPLRNLIPVPLTSMGSLHTFDSGLPCHSVWALEPSRRRHNAGRAPAAVQIGVTPNAQGRQEDQLQQVISNIMSSLLSPQNLQGQGNQATPGFAMFASGGPGDMPRGGRFFMDGTSINIVEPQTADRVPRRETSETTATGSCPPRSSQNVPPSNPLISDDVFTNLIQAIATQMSGSGQNQSTVADVLTRLDGTINIDERNILGNLFMCIAREATFQDLVAMFFGNAEPINRIKETLQRFLREQVLQSSDPHEGDINLAVEQIIIQGEEILQIISRDSSIRTDVDYKATITSFCRQNFRKLFHAILHPPEAPSFGSYLYTMCKTALSEFLALNIHCFTDGASSLERIANERINLMTTGMNPLIRQWMAMMTTREIRNSIPNINVPLETVREYIVNRGVPSSPESPPTVENVQNSVSKPDVSGSSVDSHVNPPQQGNRQVATGHVRLSGNQADATLAAFAQMAERSKHYEDGATPINISTRTHESRRNSNPISVSNGDITEVVIGTETWHNTVPRDWVPIIARDVQRQRRQATQAPFSDAYLGGMPSKRRKIMTNVTQTNIMGTAQNSLPDILLQSIANANVQPVTSLEELKREASQDVTLQAAFNDHIKRTVQERLQSDLDYRPEKFPNAEQYFNVGCL